MSIQVAVLGEMLISSFLSRQISTIRSNLSYLFNLDSFRLIACKGESCRGQGESKAGITGQEEDGS